ncbi:efflux transporter outer membrane subunit [Azoarcus sp. L1K30]|uniref:efflux transporter outer membrane subunit n=1 Tax=Azoarcus sp. L1K30 TaxID=2820277 RepID=UPI001B80F062|nr:efflux transporter outer membrane subunit [Azoarcus sp. L1K30]MBR0564952.1 efflux transporter outer membrane subunit [Azoarcus sp. L1K30]
MPEHIYRLPWLLLPLVAGCANAPPGAPAAAFTLPMQWRLVQPADAVTPPESLDWQAFGNAELAALIDEALAQAPDIAVAMAAERQAEAVARVAGADRWPALDLELSGVRNGGASSGERIAHSASLAASYEIDVWGRQQALRDAAQAGVEFSHHDRTALRLSLAANVANLWLGLQALREQIAIAEADWLLVERTLALTEIRLRAGSADTLDVARQRGLLGERQRSLVALRLEYDNGCQALGALLGRSASVEPQPADLASLPLPAVNAGLPSELLRRRPDLARAEAALLAADADVAAARAALLPTVSLSASGLAGGRQIADLFANPAYSLFAALARPIFDGGRLAARHDAEQARREGLLYAYHAAIVAAFADTQTALNTSAGSAAQLAAQAEVVRQAEIAWQRADARYRAGALAMIDLLDSQRTLHAARHQLLADRLACQRAAVALFRALGGGWLHPAREASS